ncbi:xyloglucan endotransglucosylase/hydrolase protein 2-like [Argentina anserina]|uniref:xyloglucan endotransglucosylase/hydrolase protein 2-like n=1 Tax=Argentina anserina TaxID=57926 RepID=UPI0021768C96|nr:xyloglucan endotransglucosylase/hydrolase protein 2-like [Potentilla anserina]
MAFPVEVFVVLFLFCSVMLVNGDVLFDENYQVTWGHHHALLENGGTQMQIYLDNTTGAGFGSKQTFGAGWFEMRIKVPVRDCAGVVLAFYLRSQGVNGQDELDFEFLGNRENRPITLQTNVITNGQNYREQRTVFWFDPTADFHGYKILWNHHQVVFYVDEIPIRVFRNNKKFKVAYPTRPMEIAVSIWDGSSWATDGGREKIDFTRAPFRAYFRKFDMHACVVDRYKTEVSECYATKYLWNHRVFRQLNATEQAAYDRVRRDFMNYDYCTDHQRFNNALPRECTLGSSNQQYNGTT